MKEDVWCGVVRNGRARFGLSGRGADSLTENPELIVEIFNSEGLRTEKSVGLQRLHPDAWSGDQSAGELSSVGVWYETDCTLESLGMVAAMKLTLGGQQLPWKRNYSLENTLPLREKECEVFLWFGSSRNRFHDTATLKWVADQVFYCDLADASCRVNAKVISLYKSIELGEDHNVNEFEQNVSQALQLCQGLGRTSRSKTDEVFLRISVLTVAWHLCISMGWFERAEEFLEESAYLNYSRETMPPFAFNIACAKLMLFSKLLISGRPESSIVAKELRELFYYAVSLETPIVEWFRDYGAIHRKAMLAFSSSEKLRKGETISEREIRDLVTHSIRVGGDDFLNKAMRFVGVVATVSST